MPLSVRSIRPCREVRSPADMSASRVRRSCRLGRAELAIPQMAPGGHFAGAHERPINSPIALI